MPRSSSFASSLLSTLTAASSDQWDSEDIPSLAGKTAVVTGATSGIGYEMCLQLATHGARVVLTGRDAVRVNDSASRLRAARPLATVDALVLDVGSFKSVDAFVKEVSVYTSRNAHWSNSSLPWLS